MNRNEIFFARLQVFYWSSSQKREKLVELWERKEDIVTTIRGLKPGTSYHIQTAAINDYGTGPKSAAATLRTDEERKLDEAFLFCFAYSRYSFPHGDPGKFSN